MKAADLAPGKGQRFLDSGFRNQSKGGLFGESGCGVHVCRQQMSDK